MDEHELAEFIKTAFEHRADATPDIALSDATTRWTPGEGPSFTVTTDEGVFVVTVTQVKEGA